LDTRDLEGARELLGRARARYRLQRVRDALADLEEALAIAAGFGDHRVEVEVLLEYATALDWSDDYAGSASITERAIARYREAGDGELGPDIALARARMIYRQTGPAAIP